MHPTQIVKQPLLTEKSTWEAERHNRYAFEIHPKANKTQVRQAVQDLYNVRVKKVRTQRRLGKPRRTRFGISRTKSWKRAVVELHPEDRIELL